MYCKFDVNGILERRTKQTWMHLFALFRIPSITLKHFELQSSTELWTTLPTTLLLNLLQSKHLHTRLHHIFWIICTFPFAQPTTAEFPFDAMLTAVISVLLIIKVPSTWEDLTFCSFTTPSCTLYASRPLDVFLKLDSVLTTLKPENLPGIWRV